MASFWRELKRRSVFRVGLAYLAAAWLLLQVAEMVLSSFAAPAWIIQTLIFSFAVGFPVALLLAWFYELTPEGLKADSDVEAAEGPRFKGRHFDFAIIAVLVFAVGFLLVANYVIEADAVIDNIMPYRLVPTHRLCNHRLGTNPIGGGHQDRVPSLEQVIQSKHAAKGPDASQDRRGVGALDHLPHPLKGPHLGLDIHTGIRVSAQVALPRLQRRFFVSTCRNILSVLRPIKVDEPHSSIGPLPGLGQT